MRKMNMLINNNRAERIISGNYEWGIRSTDDLKVKLVKITVTVNLVSNGRLVLLVKLFTMGIL